MEYHEPSEFWRQLGELHQKELTEYGHDLIKRRQAFKYFNWSWRWSALWRSEQFHFLLKNTELKTIVKCVLTPAALRDEAWKAAPLNRADRWLYTCCTRLLCAYATKHDPTGTLKLPEPQIGGPLPVFWQDRQISQDLANSALELSSITRALAGRSPINILEIG